MRVWVACPLIYRPLRSALDADLLGLGVAVLGVGLGLLVRQRRAVENRGEFVSRTQEELM